MDRIRRRRSIRLADYDYSQPGAYFVTICAHRHACLFGRIEQYEVQLCRLGRIVTDCWQEIPEHFPTVRLDEWIVMPNHLHGILVLSELSPLRVGARHASPLQKTATIATIVGSFKSAAAKCINEIRAVPGAPIWQRNYYEHIVRGERALQRIRRYIAANPANWAHDPENPAIRSRRGNDRGM